MYGFWTSIRPITPLFYKIIVYAFGSYFLSMSYSLLFKVIVGENIAFHAGYLGYVGMFFFLFSSYFGALDRLADDKNSQNLKYRILSFIPPICILFMAAGFTRMIVLLPVAGTAYYACKHLLLPDIEMGIIRVLRPYNLVVLLFCLIQPFTIEFVTGISPQGAFYTFAAFFNLILVSLALPLAYRGVRKWFI